MDRFFTKIFIRNLSRKGMFPIINIAGLSIGLAAVLLICAFIFNEYSFDKSFLHHQRIYRANMQLNELAQTMAGKTMSNSPKALAYAMKEEVPGVEAAVRVFVMPTIVRADEQPFKIEKFCWADGDFFRLFDTPFSYGSPEEAFARRGTVTLSGSQAKVLFGDKNPMGEILTVDNQPMEVSAVYMDFPANSSFAGYHVIGHFMSAASWINEPSWYDRGVETFLLLAPKTDVSVVEARSSSIARRWNFWK